MHQSIDTKKMRVELLKWEERVRDSIFVNLIQNIFDKF